MNMKIRVKNYLINIQVEEANDRLYLKFPYNKDLIKEIKCFEGAKWHGYDDINPRKIWSIAKSKHNQFQLDYLSGLPVYSRYDADFISFNPRRNLYKHQIEGVRFILTRKQCILAYDTGIGKTLIAIEALESKFNDPYNLIIWLGPKSALIAVQYEFQKWKSKLINNVKFYTYDSIKNYTGPIPDALVCDEAQKIKTPTAQRSQATRQLADKIREKDGYIILMSGTPAPKSPLDWWHLSEVACPGFLKEGNLKSFRDRLALVKAKESISGGMYPELVTWWDNENKCQICGRSQDAFEHDFDKAAVLTDDYHAYQKSKNEVKYLYERLKGLVLIEFKKNCLEIPEKTYRIIECKPTPTILRSAQMITKNAKNAITAMTLLRELSDGFQYQNIEDAVNQVKCPLCFGSGKINIPVNDTICDNCNGLGLVNPTVRATKEVSCPKESILSDLLEEYEDIGRTVIYGGFTGSIERIIKIVKKEGWDYIRVDGRGWESNVMGYKNSQDMLKIFQECQDLYPKVAFIAQPGAGGIGLTLTASPVCIYYSNDFNGDSRQQSEDRIHRIGMDNNRGATIIDLIHLESDRKILDNLQKKKDLQSITLGEFDEVIKNQLERVT